MNVRWLAISWWTVEEQMSREVVMWTRKYVKRMKGKKVEQNSREKRILRMKRRQKLSKRGDSKTFLHLPFSANGSCGGRRRMRTEAVSKTLALSIVRGRDAVIVGVGRSKRTCALLTRPVPTLELPFVLFLGKRIKARGQAKERKNPRSKVVNDK